MKLIPPPPKQNGQIKPTTPPLKSNLAEALQQNWDKFEANDFYEKDGKNYPKIGKVREVLEMPDLKANQLFKALQSVKAFTG